MERRKQRWLKQGDTAPQFVVTLTHDTDVPINLTDASVRFHLRNLATGVVTVDAAGAVHSVSDKQVRYDWQAGDSVTAGLYEFEFEITYSDGTIETFPNWTHGVLEITSQIA